MVWRGRLGRRFHSMQYLRVVLQTEIGGNIAQLPSSIRRCKRHQLTKDDVRRFYPAKGTEIEAGGMQKDS